MEWNITDGIDISKKGRKQKLIKKELNWKKTKVAYKSTQPKKTTKTNEVEKDDSFVPK